MVQCFLFTFMIPDDKPQRLVSGKIRDTPVVERPQPVTVVDERHQVHKNPQKPGDEAFKMRFSRQVCHSFILPDNRHRTFVFKAKSGLFFPIEHCFQVPG